MFQGAMFWGLFYLTRLTIGLSVPGLAFFGRPPLRSRGALFQMSSATFRDRPKWFMAALSNTSRPALLRSALSAFRFSSINASTSPSEGRRAAVNGREVRAV